MNTQAQNTPQMPDIFYIVAKNYDGCEFTSGWGSSDMTDRDTAYGEFADSEHPARVLEVQCVDGFPKNIADVTHEFQVEVAA